MRLSPAECHCIVDAVGTHLPPFFVGTLILFGSQVDNAAKGGDIDLVLIANSSDDLRKLKMSDYKIVASIKSTKEIGGRKIDFQVLSPEESSAGFYGEALKKSIVLYKWDRR